MQLLVWRTPEGQRRGTTLLPRDNAGKWTEPGGLGAGHLNFLLTFMEALSELRLYNYIDAK